MAGNFTLGPLDRISDGRFPCYAASAMQIKLIYPPLVVSLFYRHEPFSRYFSGENSKQENDSRKPATVVFLSSRD